MDLLKFTCMVALFVMINFIVFFIVEQVRNKKTKNEIEKEKEKLDNMVKVLEKSFKGINSNASMPQVANNFVSNPNSNPNFQHMPTVNGDFPDLIQTGMLCYLISRGIREVGIGKTIENIHKITSCLNVNANYKFSGEELCLDALVSCFKGQMIQINIAKSN